MTILMNQEIAKQHQRDLILSAEEQRKVGSIARSKRSGFLSHLKVVTSNVLHFIMDP